MNRQDRINPIVLQHFNDIVHDVVEEHLTERFSEDDRDQIQAAAAGRFRSRLVQDSDYRDLIESSDLKLPNGNINTLMIVEVMERLTEVAAAKGPGAHQQLKHATNLLKTILDNWSLLSKRGVKL